MLIYVLTSVVNGKQYVGKTRQSLIQRWKQHVRTAKSGRQSCIHAALRERGYSAFTHRILSEALNEKAADQLERFWIRELGTLYPAGYNKNNGGAARPVGYSHRLDTKSKMSRSRLGHKDAPRTLEKRRKRALGNTYHLGHTASTESRARMSAAQRRRYAKPHAS